MPDLQINDLTVEFVKGDYTVRPLDGMSVTVKAGSLALLLGPSGCGKTTLLSCLAAIMRPTSGSITYGDTDVTALSGHALTEYRRHGVGVVFQAFNLVPSLTSVENVAVPMRSAGIKARDAKAKSIELLEGVGPGRTPDAPAEQPQRRPAAAGRHRSARWRSTRRWCWPTSPPPTWTTCRSRACCG